jgi:hypothetical protein
MPAEQASALVQRLISLMPTPRRWFTNCDGASPRSVSGFGWDSATRFTFDLGVVAVGEGRAWIAWFTDED